MFARVRQFLSQPTTMAIARMCLFSLFGIVIIGQDIVNYRGRENLGIWALAAALWILLLIDYVRRIRRAQDKRTFVLHNLGYPIFLITGALIPFDHPLLVALPLILGYALQVRELAAGRALMFSFALVMFILLICGLGLYIVEKDVPGSSFTEAGPVMSWSVARLFRVYGSSSALPTTEQGKEIAFTMGVVAIVAAGLFTGQIIRWFIRADEGDKGEKQEDKVPGASAEDVAALRDQVAQISDQLSHMSQLLDEVARSGRNQSQAK